MVFDGHLFFSSRVATVATLPSALFDERFGSLGASWVFWFQPVLPSVYRPRFHLEDESWARRLTQSPELGFRLWRFLSQRVLVYAAAGIARCLRLRNGSYTAPPTHSRCSKTASFRATAIMARFFPLLPPRSASFRPQRRRSLSAPNGPRMGCAPCTNSVRRYGSPSLRICICGSLWPALR